MDGYLANTKKYSSLWGGGLGVFDICLFLFVHVRFLLAPHERLWAHAGSIDTNLTRRIDPLRLEALGIPKIKI